jgi:hypothetical protein
MPEIRAAPTFARLIRLLKRSTIGELQRHIRRRKRENSREAGAARNANLEGVRLQKLGA